MKKEKKELFNSLTHGITLIALVITVVIIVILAAVAIDLSLDNNGIFSKAKFAKKKMLIAAAKEEIELAITDEQIKAETGENLGNVFLYSNVWDELRQKDSKLQVVEKTEDNSYETTYKKLLFKIDEKKNVIYIGDGKELEEPSTPDPTKYVIKYYKNDGTETYEEQIVEVGQEITLEYDRYTMDGYIITGWYGNAECTGTKVIKVNNNITIYAKWEEQSEMIAKGATTKDGEHYDESYEIWNKSQLATFRDMVDDGEDFENTLILQKADIDLNPGKWTSTTGEKDIITTFVYAEQWDPIGEADYVYSTNTTSNVKSFKGTYDGDNKKIEGLYIHNDSLDYAGLFAYNEGTIKNIILKNSDIYARYNTGGIVVGNISTIKNCINYAKVSGTFCTGGICSWGIGATIENCVNNGKIECTEDDEDGICIGGIVGWIDGQVRNSSNNGEICITKDEYNLNSGIGGIVGSAFSGNSTIENCYNTGNITRIGGYVAGGILGVGPILDTDGTVTITCCYNQGNISATSVAGIIAWGYNVNIIDCYNKGIINNNGTSSYTGGITGWIDSNSSITNCYNVGNVTSDLAIGTGSLYGAWQGGGDPTMLNNYCLDTSHTYAIGGANASGNWGTLDTEDTQNDWDGHIEVKTSTQIQGLVSTLNAGRTSEEEVWTADEQINGVWKYNNGYPILKWQIPSES